MAACAERLESGGATSAPAADVAMAGAFVTLLRQQNKARHILVVKRKAAQQPMDAAMATIDCAICKQLSYLAYVCAEVGAPHCLQLPRAGHPGASVGVQILRRPRRCCMHTAWLPPCQARRQGVFKPEVAQYTGVQGLMPAQVLHAHRLAFPTSRQSPGRPQT